MVWRIRAASPVGTALDKEENITAAKKFFAPGFDSFCRTCYNLFSGFLHKRIVLSAYGWVEYMILIIKL